MSGYVDCDKCGGAYPRGLFTRCPFCPCERCGTREQVDYDQVLNGVLCRDCSAEVRETPDLPAGSEALFCTVAAARDAAVAVSLLWRDMSAAEKERWLKEAETRWPRPDVPLRALLPAAEQILTAEQETA